MKDLLDKIGVYNIFNFLLPGVLFAVILESLTTYSIIQENLVAGAFLYYFVGLVISRFGSLVIEPVLKKIYFVKFMPYTDFISASKSDPKIEILSQENNMYRTFVALFVLLLFSKIYELFAKNYPPLDEQGTTIIVVVLMITFIFSYRKQTFYIANRIKATKT